MINPFVICSVDELRVIRQHQAFEVWLVQCRTLRADEALCRAYDADARRYAATTPYPNSDVIAYARKLALEALARGESLPDNAEEAIDAENTRLLAAALRAAPGGE